MGKMDLVRTVVDQIKRNAPAQHDAAPAAMVPAAMVPFEKRVLMDAVLEWDIGGLSQTTTLLSGLHNLISAQVDGYTDFLDDFSALADTALSTMDILGELNGANGNDNQAQLEEMIARMSQAITELKDGSLSALSAIFTPEGQAPIDFDNEIETLLEDALIAFADDAGAFDGMSAAQRTAAEADFTDAITTAQVAGTFNLSAFTSNTITEKVDALADTLATSLAAYGLDAADIAGEISKTADDYFNGLLGDGLSMGLDDIEVTIDGVVHKLVEFENAVVNGVVSTSLVNVSINLPSLNFDLDSILDFALGEGTSPVSLNAAPDAQSITFNLSSLVETTGAVVDAIGVHIADFEFAPLFEIGGEVDLTGVDASVTLGMLTAGVTGIQTAGLRATVVVDADLDFGGKLNLTGAAGIESFASDPNLDILLEIDQVELDPADDEGFVEVVEDASYGLIALNLEGALNFFGDADDADSDAYEFAANVIVTSVVNNAASTTAALAVSNFLNDMKVDFDADLSASVTDDTLREALEQTIEALVGMGIDEITGFLGRVGDLVADVLDALTTDIEIPFTDFEISQVVDEINGVFTGLADMFVIDSAELGYPEGEPTTETISPAVDTQLGGEIVPADLIAALADFTTITFAVVNNDQATDTVTHTEIVIDLDGDVVWTDAAATEEDRLNALLALLNDALGADGFEFTLVAGALQAVLDVAANPGRSITILGATRRGQDEDLTVDPIIEAVPEEFDGTVDLTILGFGTENLSEIEGLTAEGGANELMLTFVEQTGTSFTPGDKFDEAMVGVEALRYIAVVDGETIEVMVERPEDGWYDELTGAANLEAMVEAFNTALEEAGVAIEAALNDAEDGIDFTPTADAEGEIEFGIDPEKLTRAFDLETLVEWVNVRLNDAQLLEGSQLKLTAEGKLMFIFPTMETDLVVGTDEVVGFDTSELAGGVGMLADVSLSARLLGALNAKFDASIGIDLLGFVADLIGDSGDSAMDARADAEEAEAEAEAAGEEVDGPTLLDHVLENVFFSDLALSVDVTGIASNITGTADIGLLAVAIGRNDATQNYVTINAQMDVTLVGQRGGEDYGSEVSLRNLIDAVTFKDANGEYDGLRGLNGLIGRTDFQGGIVTDGAGNALDADGNVVEDRADLRVENADEYELQDGEVLSMLHVYLGDVSLDTFGVQGLNEGFIDGISVVVNNLAAPIDTLSYALIGEGAESVEALSNLGEGDILDSFATIANMLSVMGASLKEKLPFLDEDIPLLNFSLLDAVDFSSDFAKALQEFRDNPNAGLAKADQYLEQYFGDDTITLTWDADAKTLNFKLSLEFLKDYAEEIAFNFDLAAVLGDALGEALGDAGEIAASLITGFVDVGGDGKLVFDPDLTLDLAFGIDLSNTLVDLTELAAEDTPLSELSTVGSLTESDRGTADFSIRWRDVTDSENKIVRIDIGEAETLGDLVALIDAAVKAEFGDTVSFEYDAATGQITLTDSNADLTDVTQVNALFGTTLEGRDFHTSEPASAPAVDDPATDEDESAAYIPQVLALAEDFADFAGEFAFTLAFGPEGGEFVETVLVELAADAARTTAEAFATALNAALAALDVPRNAINANSVAGWTIAASSLMKATVEDGVITLTSTNFTDAIGADPFAFGVGGTDISHDVSFTLTELGGSNALRLLGFETLGEAIVGEAVSETLFKGVDIGAPRVFLDTEESGIMVTMVAGAPEGLNLKLGLGPLSVNVVDGSAQLTAGAGLTDPAFLGISFVDVDGDDHENQYDLSDLFDIAVDENRSFADVLALDIGIAINVDLGFSDSLGIMNPADHGLSYTTDLVTTNGPVAFSDIDFADLANTFSGDLVNIFEGNDLEGEFELNLPDLTDMLSNFNILALLNNPRAVLDGLDMILDQMQSLFDDYLSDIDLPIVGDTIGSAVTFFNDFRYNVIEKARVIAETPMENGELPTTVDLVTGWFNDQLNELFNPDGTPIQFIQMYLNTDGGMTDSYLYGAINFSAEIFREKLDISLDLGIPGFEIEVNEGSEVELALGYSVNIGFGMDKNGFFLLNDTTQNEIGIEFIADAGSLQGSAKLLGLLGVKADAVTIGSGGGINGVGTAEGTLEVTASLGVNLFGTDGVDIVEGTAGDDEIEMDLSGIDLKNGLGQTLEFEKLVYLSKIDTDQLVAFTFNANVDIQIALEANIIDPTTGEPMLIGGAAIIPSVLTEIVFQGNFDSAQSDLGFQITALEFQNVRMDVSVLYEAIIKPVLDPIMEFIEPILPLIEWMNEEPFSFLVDALGKAFPIFGIVATVLRTVDDIYDFVETMNANGGMFIFGDFDFTSSMQDGGDLQADKAEISTADATQASGSNGNPFGVFGNTQSGFSIEIPLLTDPMSALNILTGNFEQVDLIEVTFTLMNLNFPRTSIVDMVLDSFEAPGWVKSAISSVFKAEIEARLIAQITAGYDLGGIVNFINTLDPERLLDGVYLDSSKHLLDVYFGLNFDLNLGIAGINGGAHAGVTLDFNDPNDDGKLRIPELLAIIDASGDVADFLGNLFKGNINAGADLSLWAGIRLPWPLPDLIFDVTIFDLEFNQDFGGNDIGATISTEVDDGDTAILNIGARAGANMTSIDQDGDDTVIIDGPNSPIQVSLNTNQGSTSGEFNQNAGGLIIPAGEGNNTIDMSQLTFGKPTVTYTGAGKDTIILPNSGLNVVFAGDGVDTITQTGASTGTYVIFGGGGADKINIQNGNVIYFGDDDFGMRDSFMTAFRNGGLTEAAMLSMLGLNADGTVASGGTYTNPAGGTMTLDALLTQYTALTQLSAANTVETVTVGGGNHVILTGRAADQVTVTGSIGQVKVYSGDGADVLRTGGATLYVEAGAGADRVFTSAGTAEVWGWGKQAGEDGTLGTNAGQEIDALAQRDGADLMIGGAGDDKFYGQLGRDIIEGNGGNDTGVGGLGVDLITGGTFNITTAAGAAVVIANMNPANGFGTGITVSVTDAADGHDSLIGGLGADILLGGGGNDTVDGGANADVVIGDFALLGLSSNLVAESIVTQFDTSGNAGTDVLTGGQGNDVLIAGGSAPGSTESITDTEGSNVILGDFGRVAGPRLSEAVTLVESFASAKGGADSITTGRGNDMILGGEGNDTITAGRGGDIVIGDLGTIDITNRTVESIVNANAGSDSIAFDGTGQDISDIAIAGVGDDTITSGRGGLLLLGDDGKIILDPAALSALRAYEPIGNITDAAALAQAQADDAAARDKIAKLAVSLVSANSATDGHDSVAVTGAGYLRAVMGGGNDTVSLGTEDSYVLADDGSLLTISGRDADNNPKSGVEMIAAVSLRAGDDTVTSQGGADMIIGGAGNDSITLGAGDDAVLGDMGQLKRETVLAVTTLTATADTTLAGDDTISGLAGAKTVLLGQGDDVATLGNTGSLVLGDTGAATMVGGAWNARTDQSIGGNDSITVGSGADLILAGIGDDTVDAGAGNNIILGDTGSYDDSVLTSASDAADGNDVITADGGLDRVILGGGADSANLGAGDNRVIGDSGVMDWAAAATEKVEVSDILIGGSDTITTTAGNDIVFGAAGGDSIDAGIGDNLILGDAGSWTPSVLTSASNTADGDDTVTAGAGQDRVILGGGADSANLGAGDNRVIGDSGVMDWAAAATEKVEVSDILIGGSDTITTTAGNDIVFGAAGGDSIDAGIGDNLILGDAGSWTPSVLTSASNTADGDDTVTAGAGQDRVILGGGADSANLGAGDNRVIGDSGVMDWAAAATEKVEVSDILIGGSDTITTTAGNDIVFGAAGGDSIDAGIGDNLILGDAGSWTPSVLTSASNTADGDDTVTAGAGQDRVILGGGADSANLGAGDNRVIGDSGVMDWAAAATEKVEVSDILIGGSDTITTTAGNDIVFGAAGGDSIDAGIGDNLILGDAGSWTPSVLTSASNTADGDDTVTAGAGQDRVILGGGADSANLGTGDNRVIGDSGVIGYNAGEYAEVSDNAVGGNDTITTTGGADIVIGAVGGDIVNAGNGDNLILGDTGRVAIDAAGRARMTGEDTANGDADLITTGNGRDAIIAGLSGDTVTSGAGDDAILGDLGRYTAAENLSDGTLKSLTSTIVLGDDLITSGAGNDMVVAGLGDDTVFAGIGEDLVMGDAATVTFAGNAAITTFEAENITLGGADVITTFGASGDDIVMGQAGADTIDAAGGDDLLIADLAVVTLSAPRDALAGQTAADRLLTVEGVHPELGFDDVVDGGAGGDIIMAGFGADSVNGQLGQDIIIGDSATITRNWQVITGGAVQEEIQIDTNFAFLNGGTDTLKGAAGADIMIGGLGADLFYGNTEDDLLFSDGYAGLFKSTFVDGFLTSPIPHRALFTSNFAGAGAIDVVSEAQQNGSIGNLLDNLLDGVNAAREQSNEQNQQQETPQQLNTAQLEAIFDLLASQEVLQAVAELLTAGASEGLISEALQNYLYSSGVLSQNINPLQLELIMTTIVSQLTKSAIGDAANQTSSDLPLAAE